MHDKLLKVTAGKIKDTLKENHGWLFSKEKFISE